MYTNVRRVEGYLVIYGKLLFTVAACTATRSICVVNLELVHLVFGVTQLLEVSGKLTLLRWTVFHARDSFVQSRRSTNEDFHIVLLWSWNGRLQQVFSDHALALLPVLRWLVEDMECAEAVGILLLEFINLILEDHVVLANIAKDHRHLGLVLGVVEDRAAQLPHGCDTGSTGDECDLIMLVGGPGVFRDRALDIEGLTGFHGMDVFAHRAVGVHFYDKVEEAACI